MRFNVIYDDGTRDERDYTLLANARLTVRVADDFAKARDATFSVIVESLSSSVPITVETAQYQSSLTMHVAVRTKGAPEEMTGAVRAAVRAIDPQVPLARVTALTAMVERALAQPRFAMLLVVAFGMLSLLLASVGLYGVAPTDPLSLAGVAALLFTVALIACCMPARRAPRVDPLTAMRAEWQSAAMRTSRRP